MKDILDNQRPVGRRWQRREASHRAVIVRTIFVTCGLTAVLLFAGRYFFIDSVPQPATSGAILLNADGNWMRIEVQEGIARIESMSPTGRFTLTRDDLSLSLGADDMRRIVDALGGIPIKVSEKVEYTGPDNLPLMIDPGVRLLDGDRVAVFIRRPEATMAGSIKTVAAGVAARVRELEANGEPVAALLDAALPAIARGDDGSNSARIVAVMKGLAMVAEPDIAVKWDDVPAGQEPLASSSRSTAPEAPPQSSAVAPPPATSSRPPVASDPRILRVRILNGTGVSGIAARAASNLPRNKFDVIETANADNFRYQTTIIRSAAAEDAAMVANALRLGQVAVTSVRSADVEVVLGRDARSRW